MPDCIGGRSYPAAALQQHCSKQHHSFSVVSRSRIIPPISSLCARLSTAQLFAARAALAGIFLLTPPQPCPSTGCWLLRHAALTTTHAHVVLQLATCSKQLARLLLLALFVRQAASSIQHTGLVAQWLDLRLLKSAVPDSCRSLFLWPPRWRSVVSSMVCGPVVGWDP